MKLENFYNIDFVNGLLLFFFLVYVIVRNIEFFLLKREFGKNGLFAWQALKMKQVPQHLSFIRLLDVFCKDRVFLALLAVSTVLSIAMLFIRSGQVGRILFMPVFFSNLVIGYRNRFGWDGSDKFITILNFCLLFIFLFPGSAIIQKATLIFICAQVLLSYAVAGISKLFSKTWTKGLPLKDIFSTKMYRNEWILIFLKTIGEKGSKALVWMIILFQLLFPLSLFLPLNLFWVFIILGLLFHFINVLLLGLNRFFLAFLAAYPAVIHVKLIYFR